MLDSKSVIYTVSNASAKQDIIKYDFASQSSERVGYLNSGELPVTLLVDGTLQLYVQKENDDIRMLSSENVVTNIDIIESMKVTNFGLLLSEDWFLTNRIKKGSHLYYIFSYKTQPNGTLKLYSFKHKTALNSDSLSVDNSYVSTSKGDIISLKIGQKLKNLSFLCYDKPSARYGEGAFYPISFFLNARLNASLFGNGVLVQTEHPAAGTKLQYINFTDQDIEKVGEVDCKERSLISRSIPIKNNAIPDNWEYKNIKFTSQKGHPLAAIIIKPRDIPIKKLIFDVYAAYGTQRDYHLLPTRFYDELRTNGTAIIYPIVRGEGNWGRANASLSRTPNRQAAVDDVAEVIKKLRKEILARDGKVVLRGAIAGAWLSVQTALNNSGLIDHVIANSGAYFFENQPRLKANGFFDDSASVDSSNKPKCQSIFFTLIHYIDDPITPISQSQRLAKLLGANSCRGEIKGLTGDRHVLPDFRESETDATIYELMKLYHGLESDL